MASPRADVTAAILALQDGKPVDLEALVALLYDELRALASTLLRNERLAHTLQPTALAHEAWVKLVDADQVKWQGRAHFMALAARVMRRVLIDHARKRDAEKRGGGRRRVTLCDDTPVLGGSEIDLLALDEALTALAAVDARKSRVVELRFFSGMTMPEVAEALGVSLSTAEDDWFFARAWLGRRLG